MSEGEGGLKGHVASRVGVAINLGFPAWGSCFNCSNKIIQKLFLTRFARSDFNQSTYFFSLHKLSWFAVFFCYNFYHADFDRKID